MTSLHLSYWDQVTLRRLLFRGRRQAQKDIERQDARGWQPEPGCVNIPELTLQNIDGLLARLPDPGPAPGQRAEGSTSKETTNDRA